jgi:lipoate---protein ligase
VLGHFLGHLIDHEQDLGNTNFSLHLPRASFDRHSTGKLILQAVRSLGVDAHVNERNDICVGFNKISLFRDLAFTFLF